MKNVNGDEREIPAETVDNITIMGVSQLSDKSIKECLRRGISVSFFSKGGKYFGKLQSTGHINASRQRKQSSLYDTTFALELAKRIIKSKINNQAVVLHRYQRNAKADVSEQERMLKICKDKIESCNSINEVIGYEGQAAKAYFSGLSKIIDPRFSFKGRSKRPPRDEFNSMISLGYAILMNELYDKIEVKGLNPYFGFVHRDKENHPTLASDLMEEWRAVIVDSTVLSMINGHEIMKSDFDSTDYELGYIIKQEALRLFLSKLEKKFQTEVKYLDYVSFPVSFRYGISLQIDSLVRAIENENASLYNPINIR